MKRFFLVVAGLLSLTLGVIGIVVPLLPTTPLVLLAAYCFARSNDRLHHWLVHHPKFGLVIRNWQNHRGMQAEHKCRAIWLTVLSFVISLALAPTLEIRILLLFIGACVLTGISRISVISGSQG